MATPAEDDGIGLETARLAQNRVDGSLVKDRDLGIRPSVSQSAPRARRDPHGALPQGQGEPPRVPGRGPRPTRDHAVYLRATRPRAHPSRRDGCPSTR